MSQPSFNPNKPSQPNQGQEQFGGMPAPGGQPNQGQQNPYGQPQQPNQYGQPQYGSLPGPGGQPNQGQQNPYGQPQQPNQYGQQQNPYGQPYPQGVAPNDNSMAMFACLSPFLTIIPTIVLFVMYNDRPEYPLTRRAATRTLNLIINVAIVTLASIVIALLISVVAVAARLGALYILSFFIYFVALGISITTTVFYIIAAIKFNQGIDYRYPLPHMKFIKE